MKIIFECNEQEARDMLALKEQFDTYQLVGANADVKEDVSAEKRKIGFSIN